MSTDIKTIALCFILGPCAVVGGAIILAGGLGLAFKILDKLTARIVEYTTVTPRAWFQIFCELHNQRKFRWQKEDNK